MDAVRANYQRNAWYSYLASHLLAAGMIFCFSITVVQFVNRLMPDWNGSYLPWLALIVAGESFISFYSLHRKHPTERQWWLHRSAEWILIIAGLRAFMSYRAGSAELLTEMQSWSQDPRLFFQGETGILMAYAIVIWTWARSFGRDFFMLQADLDYLRAGANIRYLTNRREVRRRLAGNIFLFGGLMVILAALARLRIESVFEHAPASQAITINVIVYFFLALVVLSQVEFAIRRASWGWQKIWIDSKLARAWLRDSLLFLALIAFLASLLPSDYSLNLIDTIGYLLSLIWTFLALLFFLLLLPIGLLLAALAGENAGELRPPVGPPVLPEIVPGQDTPIIDFPWLDLARSVLFWLAFLIILGYAILQYARQNEELWQQLRRIPGWDWLNGFYALLRRWLLGAGRSAKRIVDRGRARLRASEISRETRTAWNYLRFNSLSARQQVRFLYLAMVRRAAERGIHRAASVTPSEFERVLQELDPDLESEIHALTESFLRARYSNSPISAEEARQSKRIWRTVQNKIRVEGRRSR